MNRFCIITNSCKDRGYELTKKMKSYIESKGGSCCVVPGGEKLPESAEIPELSEGIFVVGGDGTLIRASGLASEKNIPLIGVNLGHLGYLCELEESSVYSAIDEIMEGHYIIEERMMLAGCFDTAECGKKHSRKALNDIVICRRGALQLLEFRVSVNGGYLHTFRADGMIVATPTGSTGYSLSAGGPIIDPKARMILITPINAHDLNAKSIVVGAKDRITIELISRNSPKEESAEVNFDGEAAAMLLAGESVTIETARQKTRIMKLSKISFLDMLRKKMNLYS